MKRIWVLVNTLLLAGLMALPKSHGVGRDTSSRISLQGVVTDSMCGARHMMAGNDAKCAQACVQNGAKYAFLVGDRVYQLLGHDQELERMAGQSVAVVGALNEKGILVIDSVQTVSSDTSSSKNPSETPSETTVVEGLVRDIACPIQNVKAMARNFNLKCALDCAKLGSPLIILTDDGTLYTPISGSMPDQDERARLMPFVGKYVRVRGQVFERQGSHAITIEEITELKGVRLVTDAE
jgi:hypothetical protein